MKTSIITLIITFFWMGCSEQDQNINSQYSNPLLWYRNVNKPGTNNFDVFYLLPTCIWDRVDTNGDTLRYADPLFVNDREAMRPSFELAEQIFGSNVNFYSPYYRQLALQSWCSDSLINIRFPHSFDDVILAFDYYIKNINKGRPFILAGFSQGGKCVVEILKKLNNTQYQQLVAAYVIGYRVTASDTLNYKQIKPATSEKDLGVTICYNSVASTDAICPILNPNAICINPVNWSTTAMPTTLNDTVSIDINKQYNVLIVDGLCQDTYYTESLNFLFKKGNYHLQELELYHKHISENMKVRLQTFSSKK